MFGLFFDGIVFICLFVSLCIIFLLILAVFNELPTIGWLLTVLCITLYISLQENIYLICAGLFAIAGAIEGHTLNIIECADSKDKDEEGE